MKELKHDVKEVGKHFEIHGDFVSAEPYGSGHINDTYASTYDQSKRTVRYIHQRINHNILKDPVQLMDNISRVTEHQKLKSREAGRTDVSRCCLNLVYARNGKPYHQDPEGNTWRTYIFIEKATTYDVIESADQAFQAARAFGAFQKMLVDLPGERLAETIPDFHNTPKRLSDLEAAIEQDTHGRVKQCQKEIDFVLSRKAITRTLLDLHSTGDIPERITHNDTKLNNVMLDDATQEGICVIDLDTVMPGLALYDFGDLVRTSTSPAAEDEMDLSKVTMQMPMFEALVRGYLETAGDFLTAAEKAHLAFSGKLITFEIGMRFLCDYLQGDIYFKTHREGHNLDRCRTQFKLVESIESQEKAMNALVESL